ncbi:hypothetical protein V6N13_127164 [Hibiscus sabdariffa]|uniref:Uncharacterized protein n=1 Tax=Hibiscus sabdariffa TaxID=183260 RepID=A0ABR2RDU9_9ROSI
MRVVDSVEEGLEQAVAGDGMGDGFDSDGVDGGGSMEMGNGNQWGLFFRGGGYVGSGQVLIGMEGSMDGRAIGKREGGRWSWKRGASVSLAKVQMREGLDRWCPKGGDLVQWRWEVDGGLMDVWGLGEGDTMGR